MMTTFIGHLDAPDQRLSRWSGAAGIVAAVHVSALALAIWAWPKSIPPSEPPGAIMMELPSLAAESASDQTDVSDSQQMTQAAPPPSPSDEPKETPVENATPAEPAPAQEKVAEASEPLPPVEEAPLAPEPEVTLPKEMKPEPEQPKKVEEKPEKKVAEKKPDPKPAQKSESKQQQKAAASAAGKFDPNPIYRASPAYPPSARASKIQGAVVVAYSVSPSGAVSNVRVVSASPPGIFNAATLAAVRQWRFKPSASGGSRTTTVRFKLK